MRIDRRTLGDGPRLEYAVEFEAEIIVKAGGGVFLDYEAADLRRRDRILAAGFGGFAEVALGVVLRKPFFAIGFRFSVLAERLRPAVKRQLRRGVANATITAPEQNERDRRFNANTIGDVSGGVPWPDWKPRRPGRTRRGAGRTQDHTRPRAIGPRPSGLIVLLAFIATCVVVLFGDGSASVRAAQRTTVEVVPN